MPTRQAKNTSDSKNIIAHVTNKTDEFGNSIASGIVDSSRFPLLAMIKPESIYLYGLGESPGMILFQDGQGTYFDWPNYPASVRRLPSLYYSDYDNDGKKELAVIVCAGYGTGAYEADLHILKVNKDKWGHLNYRDYSLLSGDITQWFTKKFTSKYAKDNRAIIVNFNGRDYRVMNCYDETYGALKGVVYGDINKFQLNSGQEIIATIPAGFQFGKMAIVTYFGEVRAKVNFDGKSIYLSDYELMIDK